MILLTVAGGLGNQLFIWNLAHALEQRYNEKVTLVYPKSLGGRNNELTELSQYCSHRISIKTMNTLNKVLVFHDRARRKLNTQRNLIGKHFLFEAKHPDDIYDLSSPAHPLIFRGYFQSSNFVTENIEIYSQEIENLASRRLAEIPTQAIPTGSYNAMHIRRGDYLLNRDSLGLLTNEFFERGAQEFPIDVICSDSEEIIEFKSNKINRAKQLISNDLDTWDEFAVLSSASNLVISNSTFSWWAGLMVARNNGAVIAPNPWNKKSSMGDDYLKMDKFTYVNSDFE